jgi:endonuclease/exonuclease/phosphatase (EEP) superfamily protein YafD
MSRESTLKLDCGSEERDWMLRLFTLSCIEFEQTAAKRAEADALVEIFRKKKRRFVIGGDLNSLPESYTVVAIEKYLRDAGPAKDQNSWTTKPFSYGGFAASGREWRIDYCFATPDVQVKSARVVETLYSDHLPILVDFEL